MRGVGDAPCGRRAWRRFSLRGRRLSRGHGSIALRSPGPRSPGPPRGKLGTRAATCPEVGRADETENGRGTEASRRDHSLGYLGASNCLSGGVMAVCLCHFDPGWGSVYKHDNFFAIGGTLCCQPVLISPCGAADFGVGAARCGRLVREGPRWARPRLAEIRERKGPCACAADGAGAPVSRRRVPRRCRSAQTPDVEIDHFSARSGSIGLQPAGRAFPFVAVALGCRRPAGGSLGGDHPPPEFLYGRAFPCEDAGAGRGLAPAATQKTAPSAAVPNLSGLPGGGPGGTGPAVAARGKTAAVDLGSGGPL